MQARTQCCQVEDVKWEEDEEADLGRGTLLRCRQFVKSGKGDGVGDGPGVDLRGGAGGLFATGLVGDWAWEWETCGPATCLAAAPMGGAANGAPLARTRHGR